MKNILQNLAVYLQYNDCNLAGFRMCLARDAMHTLSSCYGLLTALVLFNSVAKWQGSGTLLAKGTMKPTYF